MSAGLRTTASELASLIFETSRSFFGNVQKSPLETSRNLLWKHEKNRHKNIPWILGRTDGENMYDF